jgi:dihydrofolate synthase/folylpolyglutamate synthase
MTYPQTIQYLESFINYEKIPVWPYKESLKLARIRNFLAAINNPQDDLKCIHIAGTKGKGSTCAFCAYILREAGFKVGLYTSPHLSDFRERIRILQDTKTPACQQAGKTQDTRQDFEGMISENELIELVEKLKPAIERYDKNSKYGPLSFFEVYTALAFVYFKEQNVDFTVLETGLGGRLDATNVVNSYVSAITPISYEHTQKLGNRLKEITKEKAGIIKRHKGTCLPAGRQNRRHKLIVISAPQAKEVIDVIRKRCKETDAKLYEVGKDIPYQRTRAGFSVKGILAEYSDLRTGLLGDHQLINAALAIGVIEALHYYNINVHADSIRRGIYNAMWPGRCEVLSKEPLVVLDGAQNVASSEVLEETVRKNFEYERLILVLGISKDKDIKGICHQLYDLADEIILTKADNPRATSPEALAKYFSGKDIYITGSVQEAKIKAFNRAGKEDLILVTGSLFVIGEFRNGNIRPK